MNEFCNKSGQIPAFGNWDYANDLPITQYFESARQAGLLRYASSSFGECDLSMAEADLYPPHLKKPHTAVVPVRKTRVREKRNPHVKEEKSQGKVFDVTETPRKPRHQPTNLNPKQNLNQLLRDDPTSRPPPPVAAIKAPKPVDEDLYKIPPELLHTSKRKKVLGFLSRCLVPSC